MEQDSYAVVFRADRDEPPDALRDRLGKLAGDLASTANDCSVVLLVADGHPEIPVQPIVEPMEPPTFAAVLLVSGIAADALPRGDALYRVRSRVIKPMARGADGARTSGFTMVCPIVRAGFLSREKFDAHWLEQHAPLHVRCSPTTARYEQLVVDESMTPGAPPWDGIGVLAFASARDFEEDLFTDAEATKEVIDDLGNFLDVTRSEALAVSEYVYRG